MRIENVEIQDVFMTSEFIDDYMRLTNHRVKRAVDKYVSMLINHGHIPNSMRAHKAKNFDLWISYVTVGRKAWRLLFTFDEISSTILLTRIMNHDEMDELWKTL